MDELVQFWVRVAMFMAICVTVVAILSGCGTVSITHSPAEVSVGGPSAPTAEKKETTADTKKEGS